MTKPLWTPSPQLLASCQMAQFIRYVQTLPGSSGIADYDGLYHWSIEHCADFWAAVWNFCKVQAQLPEGGRNPWDSVLIGTNKMQPWDLLDGPSWFPGAGLNFAENLLRYRDERAALVFWNEQGRQQELSYAQLYSRVAALAKALKDQGVGFGDRVVGFLPNMPEAVIAMLAATSLGAIWSSCSPDFGFQGVLDRFGQIEPKLLFTANGYLFKGKRIDCLDRVRQLIPRLASLERVVVVPYGEASYQDIEGMPGTVYLGDFLSESEGSEAGVSPPDEHGRGLGFDRSPFNDPAYAGEEIKFSRLPFDHPLYIMYSSGTTGLPKCMVHGAGGTLLQHLKELALHTNLTRDDTLFYFTTCGWMMWNWLVSGLAVGAKLVLYDGNPFAPAATQLWDMAQAEGISVFGTSAKYLALLEKEGIKPRLSHELPQLRAILSTGSPLLPESFDYVYRDIKADVQLASISGGTDIISCFALGNPLRPVWRGELQGAGLGMAVKVFDEDGRECEVGQPGELVCTQPFPSMPVCFWNDPDGEKYRGAYFDTFPGVWRHGDWVERTSHDGFIIHGRSDATLNPGGVRIGTAEIYSQVEILAEVVEALVVGQDWQGDVRIVLFVRLVEGCTLDEELRSRIQQRIRSGASPHHVPRKIIAVADIPRTISGKISELAVRNVIHGRAVKNKEALANPAALELYRNLPELQD